MTATAAPRERAQRWSRSAWAATFGASPGSAPGLGWQTSHPVILDVALAVAVAGFTVLVEAFSPGPWARGVLGWDLALAAVLLLRRVRPGTAAVLAGAVCLAQWLVAVRAPGDVAVLIVLYSLGVYERRRWVLLLAVLVAELGVIMAVTRWGAPSQQLLNAATATGTVTASWVAGIYLRMRRDYLASVRERAETAERDRDSQARIAVAAERARLAREMHDIIAHSLSVMITLNDAAVAVEPSPPVRKVLCQATEVGRQALGEMDRMLGVLRDGEATDFHPQPGLGQLPELVSMIRSAGLSVDLTISGDPTRIPATAQLALYRIAQESLTNVIKHGANVEHVKVTLSQNGPIVALQVDNDGGPVAPVARSVGGHGLIGMSERARLFGGELSAGPVRTGGWSVQARLTVESSRVAV